MQSFSSFAPGWRQPVWALLLVAASAAFSFSLACAMPFPALCAVAACTLPRRDAYFGTAAAWLANQVIGFGFLHYPWTANCLAWGAAIGLSALLCTLAADWASQRSIRWHPLVGCVVALVAAFTGFEAALAASAVALGGLESFTPRIVASLFGINTVAWVGFFALSWVGALVGVAHSLPPLARVTK